MRLLPRNSRSRIVVNFVAVLGIAVVALASFAVESGDPLSAEATAPENTASVGSTLGGSFFVDKELAEKADSLRIELSNLRSKILAGDISSAEANNQLEDLSTALSETKELIKERKVLVSAFNVYRKREEVLIPSEGCGMLIVTGDAVKLRGWKGADIKCVLEKTIVAKEQPKSEEFDAIRLKHELGTQAEIVGANKEQTEHDESEYLAAHPELTSEEIGGYKAVVSSIHASNAKFESFQGEACHAIELEGLKDGNENLSIKIASEGGGTTHSSQWKRHAELTIFVPVMKHVCVRGCNVKLDVQNIQSNILLTTSGSRDRDYDGSFVVRNIEGNVTIDQAPVRELTNIRGNVQFVGTDEFVNRAIYHRDGIATATTYETANTNIRNVDGDLTLHVLRTKLTVGEVSGTLDVKNDIGDTILEAEYAVGSDLVHRIVTDCGNIEVRGPQDKLEAASLHAYTRCGSLQTNLGSDLLESKSFSTGSPKIGWTSLTPTSNVGFDLGSLNRPAAALGNKKRKAGFDLISKAGEIQIIGE